MTDENPELAAALAAVPDIQRTADVHEEAVRRLARHPAGEDPGTARQAAIDEAAHSFATTGTWPDDVGAKIADAYTSALVWESERLALRQAVEVTRERAAETREVLSHDALAVLGRRLDDVLSVARSSAETLGEVTSAEDAIRAGGRVVRAWSILQAAASDVANIRAAQWAIFLPQLRRHERVGDNADRHKLMAWKRDGHGEVKGPRSDVPSFALDAMRAHSYTAAYVRWLANSGMAYVPTSFEELAEAVEAATPAPAIYDDAGPVHHLRVTETAIPTPPEPKTFAHSRAAHLDYSAPTPDAPAANATPGDPVPPIYR
ncbi:hypothetical protein [Streptomyces sp. NPDC047968]|uniref:hypothetical protein n=1 Tax=unclassified Streptomyces TaxID=2593676 RepID=UPI00341F08F2